MKEHTIWGNNVYLQALCWTGKAMKEGIDVRQMGELEENKSMHNLHKKSHKQNEDCHLRAGFKG